MTHVVRNRVKETATTTGTGAFTVAGAVSGFRAFSAVCAVNDTLFGVIEHQTPGEWEVGLYTYSASNTITRTTVLSSSNAGSLVNFSAGTKLVFIDAVSEQIAPAWMPTPGYVANRYYTGPTQAIASGPMIQDFIYLAPFFCSVPVTFTKIGFRLVTGIAASAARLGVYRDNGGQPSALLIDAGAQTTTVADQGIRELTGLAIVMAVGWYWLGLVTNAAITINHAAGAPVVNAQIFGLGADTDGGYDLVVGAHTYAALPATFPTVVYSSNANSHPHIWLRK